MGKGNGGGGGLEAVRAAAEEMMGLMAEAGVQHVSVHRTSPMSELFDVTISYRTAPPLPAAISIPCDCPACSPEQSGSAAQAPAEVH